MKHITRLKKDLAYMKQKLHCLKMQMKMIMESKFGKVIDINEIEMAIIKKNFHHTPINELEEVVLKKLVYDVRIKLTDIKSMFTSELNLWIAKGAKAQNQLIKIIKENTKRLDVLQLISKEKKDLTKMVSQQPRKHETIKKMEQVHAESLKGIEKLEAVLDSQNKQMQELKTEIKILKTKGLPIRANKPEVKVERMTDAVKKGDEKEWMDIEKYVDQEDEDSNEKQIMQEITLPGYYSNEAEDIIKDLLSEILDKTNTKLSMTSIINNILSGIMRCSSVREIVEEIINNLPIVPTLQQKGLIDISSEKIFRVNDLEASEESIVQCAHDIVVEVIEEVLNMDIDEPHEVILETAEKLVESVPPEYIFQEHSLDILTEKLSGSIGEQQIDKQALLKAIEEIPSHYKDQMMDIINVVLARVFSTGLDYLFVLENK